jgi:predicted DNA-binding protein
MTTTKTKKNNAVYQVSIPKEIRDRFLAVAKNNNTNGADLLRQFIYKYVSENQQLNLKF